MNDTLFAPVGKLGRLPAQRPIGLKELHRYGRPSGTKSWDYVGQIENWGMLGNGPDPSLTVHGGEPVGDCAFAGAVHLTMAVSTETKEPYTVPDSNEVVEAYLRYNRGIDRGAVLAQLLATWRSQGLLGSNIKAYAPVHLDGGYLYEAGYWFGALYLGVAMPAVAQQQFAAGEPWELTHTLEDREIIGGHCIVAVAYVDHYWQVVTWGRLQRVSEQWMDEYLEEAWVVLMEQQIEAHGNGYGVDLDALIHDLDRI